MHGHGRHAHVLIALAFVLAGACAAPEETGPPISEWDLFVDPATQTPSAGLEPYELVAPLFSDYAAKHRFMRLPEGGRITVDAEGRWQFPVGTVLVKTFAFPRDMRDPSLGERIIETRLLVREERRWRPYVYIWDDAVSEAHLTPAGRLVPVEFIDGAGERVAFTYRVPSHTQCGNCHGGNAPIAPLGPRTAQMDRMHAYPSGEENQIDHLVARGWLDASPTAGAPIVDYEAVLARLDAPLAELEPAARSYLHANCSHCHRTDGPADQSGLFLEIENTDPFRLGVCKSRIAGSCDFGTVVIHPGMPDDSIMVCRVESDVPGIKMPELPSVLVHEEGAALLRRWIAAMEPVDCSG